MLLLFLNYEGEEVVVVVVEGGGAKPTLALSAYGTE